VNKFEPRKEDEFVHFLFLTLKGVILILTAFIFISNKVDDYAAKGSLHERKVC